MSNQDDVKNKLREFIKETFLIGTDFDTVEDNDSFMEKEIIDSTGVLELTAFIETDFEITIEDDEMVPENLDSIDKLTAFIASKKG